MGSLPQFEEYAGPLLRGHLSAGKCIGGIGLLKGVENADHFLHNSILRRFQIMAVRALSTRERRSADGGQLWMTLLAHRRRIGGTIGLEPTASDVTGARARPLFSGRYAFLQRVTGDNGCRHSERIVSHPLANLTHQAWLFGALLILSSTVDVTRCSKPGYVSVNGSG